MKKKSKIERMILTLGGCENGLKRAARKYRGLTLAQAWRKADLNDLKEILKFTKVSAPLEYRCHLGCGSTCWDGEAVYKASPDEVRKALRVIPAKIRAAYARA